MAQKKVSSIVHDITVDQQCLVPILSQNPQYSKKKKEVAEMHFRQCL
jgi:hypothetical protein